MPDRAAKTDASFPSIKIATLEGVREYGEGLPVEIWFDGKSGRIVLSAYNQCGDDHVNVDLFDLINWLQTGPGDWLVPHNGKASVST